jgi:hypothetical protein
MNRSSRLALVLAMAALPLLTACQSPTDPDDTVDVDDFLEIAVAPNPAIADVATDGKTYRVVRGNNQPDEILAYDWKTSFTLTLTLNSQADDDDVLEFPVDLTTVSVVVKQASGGIVTPPSGGEVEYYQSVTQASANRFAAINTSNTIAFEVWYDLPSLRKEALVTVNLAFKDSNGKTFTKAYDVRVAP